MESIGCEDLDVIVGAGYAAARAALSAQEGGARVLATTPRYRRSRSQP
jgi:succinate dehydrogenase/fumarate reductase flavoprotein subunit